MNLTVLQAGRPLYEGAYQFFYQGLSLQLYGGTATALQHGQLLAREATLVQTLYLVGVIDDESLNTDEPQDVIWPQVLGRTEDYKGMVLFAAELHQKPTLTELGNLARRLNRQVKGQPAVLLARYGNRFSLVTVERTQFLRERDQVRGERAGQARFIWDIDTINPHPGHLDQIGKLTRASLESVNGQALTTFTQFYLSWLSVFSIELLNERFYGDVITWFDQAVKAIKLPSVPAADAKKVPEETKEFTIRLIARLLFVWFLKERRVVHEHLLLSYLPDRSRNPLITPKSPGSSYYKYVLQNLFFNALNQPDRALRQEQMAELGAFRNFEMADEVDRLLQLAPYLNGGLFEADEDKDAYTPSRVNNAFKVPDALFLDKETGINSILARYVFTLTENTPENVVIAVEPEMLGRIFENLLAEQVEDTRETARKAKGAFYTPRSVVAYMCRRTLESYLDLEQTPANGEAIVRKLLKLRVLDPACGSGAFPMGMLEEMLAVLDRVDPTGDLWIDEMLLSPDQEFRKHVVAMRKAHQYRYIKKLGLIRNCLYGVDILNYAVEITKLRCFLSLLVEQEVSDNADDNYGLRPLPNLDFKFYQRNTLLRQFNGQRCKNLLDNSHWKDALDRLRKLENTYFTSQEGKRAQRAQIIDQVAELMGTFIDSCIERDQKAYNAALRDVNELTSQGYAQSQINTAKKRAAKLAQTLAALALEKQNVPEYLIEEITFPDIFLPEPGTAPGFDIVIGNPPYVNTKQISKQGLTQRLKDEYDYCDDLYNHFTIRGHELLAPGGLLCYITSDTFLTLQTKENMRRLLLGMPAKGQDEGLFAEPAEAQLLELVNMPKVFKAMVDTAVFTLCKAEPAPDALTQYVDLRNPSDVAFGLQADEGQVLRRRPGDRAAWERALERTMQIMDSRPPKWAVDTTCQSYTIERDQATVLERYRLPLALYHRSLNQAIFAPTRWNCQVFDRLVAPAFPILEQWWKKIETSREIERNRAEIQAYLKKLKPGDISLLGLLTDGGQGLATGDNGRFVGYRTGTTYAQRCQETRPQKLWAALESNPDLAKKFGLQDLESEDDCVDHLAGMAEPEIWALFDGLKAKAEDPRLFGKGYIFRIVPPTLIKDAEEMTDKEKQEGIAKGKAVFVPCDKGDRDGNRWVVQSPIVLDWSRDTVTWMFENSGNGGGGLPVVRNSQFYFKEGFCWNNVLSDERIKCRIKPKSVHLTEAMTFFNMYAGTSDKFFVCLLNSNMFGHLRMALLNDSPHLTTGDAKQFPIKVPSQKDLAAFESLFDRAVNAKSIGSGLTQIEEENNRLVAEFFGITEPEPAPISRGTYVEPDELEENE